MGLTVPANASTLDRIRQIHGGTVANELLEFKSKSDRWGFKATGWISNANYSVKKTSFILFINHRAVESAAIRKAMEQMYATFLPKGGHPFVYLSLDIEPHRVDVNVHPTKREVHFLHEDEIIETICDDARTSLGNIDTSRTFMTQTLLPNARIQSSRGFAATTPPPAYNPRTPGTTSTGFPNTTRKTIRPYDNDLVRTDSRARKITTMLEPGPNRSGDDTLALEEVNDMDYEITDKEPTICRLKSIISLRTEVRENMHNELTDIFATHTFVGIVDVRRRIVAIQGGVKLFLVDYGMVCNEYFYQVGLTDFGNFGSIQFNKPLDLTELLSIGVEQERQRASTDEQESPDWDEVVEMVRTKLIENRNMLSECFSLEISEDGEVLGLPLLIKGYMPPVSKLPNFLLRLGPFVNWESEKPCFHSFLRELASFYVPEALAPAPVTDPTLQDGEQMAVDENSEIAARRRHVERALENVLFPAFKSRLVATKGLLTGVTEIANLKGLYRVFERC
jgi:DNA mismatch repair protein MLH1